MGELGNLLKSNGFGPTWLQLVVIGVVVGIISNVLGERGKKIPLILSDIVFGVIGSAVFGAIETVRKDEVGVTVYIASFVGSSLTVFILRIVRARITKGRR